MGRGTAAAIAALLLAGAGGSACAVGQADMKAADCRIVSGAKLPAESGGERQLCAAIDAAAREVAPGTPFTVEVRVLSASSLAAIVTLQDGRKLPEQKLAVSDRKLNRESIERFAAAIAKAAADAGRS
jgi:hypothetical protein